MGMINIKEKLKKDILKGNNTEKPQKAGDQSPLQIKARRLLLAFFLMMIVLTLLSKVADSITIAKITTQTPRSSALDFIAYGTGTITADVVNYVKVQEGLGIDKIYVKVGQKVKEGDTLLEFNDSDIIEALNSARKEVEKLNIQIEQEELSGSQNSISGQERAEILYENSKQDLLQSNEDLKKAEEKYEEALISYENAMTESEEEIRTEKTEEYKSAKTSYDRVSLTNEEAISLASRTVEEAKKTLEKLNNMDSNILGALEQYRYFWSKDWNKSQEAMDDLYQMAYGDDSDIYEKHKEEVEALEKKLSWANEDLNIAEKEYEEAVISVVDLSAYESALSAAKRKVWEANDALNSSNKKVANIRTTVDLYVYASSSNNKEIMDKMLYDLSQFIYGESGYRKHKEDITEAEEKLNYAEENLKLVQENCELSLAVEQDKLDKIQQVLASIEEGTYDYKKTLGTEKQAIEQTKQSIEIAKDKVETAKRVCESSKLDLEQAIQQDAKAVEAQTKQTTSIDFRKEAIQLDLEGKQQLVDKLEKLQENEGKVTALVPGIVYDITLEAGKQSGVDHYITISTGGYGLLAIVPKNEGEYVSIGDSMDLTARGKEDKIDAKVEGIRFATDVQGNEQTEITTTMPEGDYIPGATLEVKISNKSDLYNICIPIAAIRQDGFGSYVLKTQPKSTVLGEELLAVRVPITILEKDATMAAIDASLSRDDNIIISSNKNIVEGNRVRKRQ